MTIVLLAVELIKTRHLQLDKTLFRILTRTVNLDRAIVYDCPMTSASLLRVIKRTPG